MPAEVALVGPDSVQQLLVTGMPGDDRMRDYSRRVGLREQRRGGRDGFGRGGDHAPRQWKGGGPGPARRRDGGRSGERDRYRGHAAGQLRATRSCRSSRRRGAMRGDVTARRRGRTGSSCRSWASTRGSTTTRSSRRRGAGGCSPRSPSRACCLLKATAAVPHGGGRKIEPGLDGVRAAAALDRARDAAGLGKRSGGRPHRVHAPSGRARPARRAAGARDGVLLRRHPTAT